VAELAARYDNTKRVEAISMATQRDFLQLIVERLPDEAIREAEERLAPLLRREDDPLLYALANAPLDDEPLTDEDRAAIAEARAEIERGETVTLDELDAHMARRAKSA
jgi:hypothetical protein